MDNAIPTDHQPLAPDTNGTASRNSQPHHSLSIIKRYRAYFSLAEVDEMVRKQSAKLVPARVEAIRQQACVFIDKIGSRLGLYAFCFFSSSSFFPLVMINQPKKY